MSLYIVGIMIVFSVALMVYALWPKQNQEDDIIKRRMTGKRAQDTVAALRQQAKESVTQRVMKSVAPIAMRPVMMNNPDDVSKLRMRLATAGFRSDRASTMFLASKTVVAVGCGIVGAIYALASATPFMAGLGIAMCGAGLGFLTPNIWLGMAINKRKALVRDGLPDALDMLVISVESGLGLDAAMQRVGDELKLVHAVLSEELQMVTLESQMGIPRAEAMGNLANRTDLDELRAVVGTVNQAERFGTSVGRALRNQSNALRIKRRQAAEEKAQKTTVKLMLPLILFIFPAILVVLAGPAALTMIEALGDTKLTG